MGRPEDLHDRDDPITVESPDLEPRRATEGGHRSETLRNRRVLLSTAVVAVAMLFYNVGSSLCGRNLPAEAASRYYADVSIASNFASTGDFPVAAYSVRHTSTPRHDEGFNFFRRALVEAVRTADLHCWSMFGTIPQTALPDVQLVVKRADDPGRALLLGGAFKMIGIAPYLLFWLAPLIFGVVLLWVAWELGGTGHGIAAGAFLILVAMSAYAADTLALDYSAAGFYLTALLLVLPLGAYAIRPLRERTLQGVVGRAALAGVVFAISALARSGALLVAPFILGGLLFASRGLLAGRSPIELYVQGIRRASIRLLTVPAFWLAAALAGATLVIPYLALRMYTNHLVSRTSFKYGLDAPTQAHDVWLSMWEGLGDFDRTKGHFWLDERAQLLVGNKLLMTPESERILRELVLRDIKEDPLWFAHILIKRFAATVLQRKLWPWGPVSGSSLAPQAASNEGAIDSYYSLTATADRFGLGRYRFELPIQLLLIPFLFLTLRALIWRVRGSADQLLCPTLLVVFLGSSAVVLPVAVTTAGAVEPQAFVLTYFLAAAFLAEALVLRSLRVGRVTAEGRRPLASEATAHSID
jgi:hypothetical protein